MFHGFTGFNKLGAKNKDIVRYLGSDPNSAIKLLYDWEII